MEETKSGFSKHIGGITVKKINDSSYEFFTEVMFENIVSMP